MQGHQHSGLNPPGAQDHSEHGHHQHTHGVAASGSNPGSRFNWNVHHPFDGIETRAAVEVAPWSGLLPRWRFVLPADFKGVVRWGAGQAGSAQFDQDAVRRPVGDQDVQLHDGPVVDWMGGHNPLSTKLAAFLVFDGDPPHFVAFGQADEQDGPPTSLEGIYFAAHEPPHPEHDGLGGHRHDA